MFRTKLNHLKLTPKKSKLDQFLWIVENYLPQKKNKLSVKESRLNLFEEDTINLIQKIASFHSKLLTPTATKNKVSFTFGSWALPFLKFLKQIGLAK